MLCDDMDEDLLAQLILRSDELLSELTRTLSEYELAEDFPIQVNTLLLEHQHILESMVSAGVEQNILTERLEKMQQLYQQFADVHQEAESQLIALTQTRRLAQTYNPQR